MPLFAFSGSNRYKGKRKKSHKHARRVLDFFKTGSRKFWWFLKILTSIVATFWGFEYDIFHHRCFNTYCRYWHDKMRKRRLSCILEDRASATCQKSDAGALGL
jgi:hypothetical protein